MIGKAITTALIALAATAPAQAAQQPIRFSTPSMQRAAERPWPAAVNRGVLSALARKSHILWRQIDTPNGGTEIRCKFNVGRTDVLGRCERSGTTSVATIRCAKRNRGTCTLRIRRAA